jgi:hypothetical protein
MTYRHIDKSLPSQTLCSFHIPGSSHNPSANETVPLNFVYITIPHLPQRNSNRLNRGTDEKIAKDVASDSDPHHCNDNDDDYDNYIQATYDVPKVSKGRQEVKSTVEFGNYLSILPHA